MYGMYDDPQQRRPLGICPCCGREIWEEDQEVCCRCREELETE